MLRSFVALEALYSEYDKAQSELEGVIGKPICIEACGRCCESMTPEVSRLEALYILAHASFLPTYQDLRDRAEQWLTDQQIELHDDPAAFGQDYQALKHVGCPFLAEDKTCMVYNFRPLACRSYGVIRAADPWCPRPLHYTESDSNRMIIGQDTPRGFRIKAMINFIINYVKSWKPELSQVGLLPSFIAKEVVVQDKLGMMPIALAKRLRRESKSSALFAEQFGQTLVREMERNPYVE